MCRSCRDSVSDFVRGDLPLAHLADAAPLRREGHSPWGWGVRGGQAHGHAFLTQVRCPGRGRTQGAVQPGCRSESSLQLCNERAIAQADNNPGGCGGGPRGEEEKLRLPSAWLGDLHVSRRGRAG